MFKINIPKKHNKGHSQESRPILKVYVLQYAVPPPSIKYITIYVIGVVIKKESVKKALNLAGEEMQIVSRDLTFF